MHPLDHQVLTNRAHGRILMIVPLTKRRATGCAAKYE
jgi:hypothetical protein